MLELSLEEFSKTYLEPAVKELARKLKANEPLSEIEKKIVRSWRPDWDESWIFIHKDFIDE